MISISKLLAQIDSESDGLRYKEKGKKHQIKHHSSMENERPVVVWNMTKACNLNCLHCYASAVDTPGEDELDTEEAKSMIDQLEDMEVPVLIFSGGEPFLRDDLFELGQYAANTDIRPVISTNGTLIDKETATRVKEANFLYVGVSLDGIGRGNDRFRGKEGAYEKALEGMRNLMAKGIKTGLRYTITKKNASDLPEVLELVKDEGMDRLCIYHLDYVGNADVDLDLDKKKKRELLRHFFGWTEKTNESSGKVEALTVGTYADAAFLYMYAKENGYDHAEQIYELLQNNQGDGTGETISCIDSRGNVHPNQFWRDLTMGNVKKRPFGEIWTDTSQPILKGLKNKKKHVKGRCAECQYLDICEGGSRSRAKAATGNIWASDPACYLTDEEIHENS